MKHTKKLELVLDVVTEGAASKLPRALSTEAFTAESLRVEKAARGWTHGRGIQGLGIGQKVSKGKTSKQLCLKVYVEKKSPLSKLSNPVPKKLRLSDVGTLVTDVEEIGRVQAESYTQRTRPAMPGCGVGHVDVSAGTFGCLVKKADGSPGLYMLSNSHVLADEGLASIGDVILQQGRADGGTQPGDVIGTLADFVPFTFGSRGFPNKVDAAIAKVKSRDVLKTLRVLGFAPKKTSHVIRRGTVVAKVGRTTDYTLGVVRDLNYRLSLRYKKPGGGTARVGFRDQVLCTRFTGPGDSGAAVLNQRGKVIGLHFAGSPSTSIFNRITNVCDQLGVTLA